MKMMIILLGFWLLSFPVLLSAQALTHITIENLVAGGLKDSLNLDQQKKVQSLTLSGSMNKDDFSFIRYNLIALKELDMKEVNIDTIPEKVFYWDKEAVIISKMILPRTLKYIENRAFWANSYRCTFVVTGPFPALADSAFASCATNLSSSDFRVTVSDDNPYCKLVSNSIYSSDGKILYYGMPPYEIVPGTEEISPNAFSMKIIDNVSIPSSVTKIGDKAFAYMWQYPPSKFFRSFYHSPGLLCESTVPPRLGKDVFYYCDSLYWDYYLYVPDESVSVYKSLPEWSCFKDILGLSRFKPYSPGPVKADTVRVRIDNLVVGSLEDSLGLDQREVIHELTLSGEMNHSDFSFICASLPHLFKLDLSDIVTDTVSYFACFPPGDSRRFVQVYLPKHKVHLVDYVAWDDRIHAVITGEFPSLGRESLNHNLGVSVSPGNAYCRMHSDGGIYSLDGKDFYFLYRGHPEDYVFLEGTEVIHGGALESLPLNKLRFPSTLNLIEDNAFYGCYFASCDPGKDYNFIFSSVLPPVLGKDAFLELNKLRYFKVLVPAGCIGVYLSSSPPMV